MGDRLARLLKPYTGEPPPGLYGKSSDLLIRIAGIAVPHFLSVVTRLGGDAALPALPRRTNRRAVVVEERRLVAGDPDVVALTLVAADGEDLPRWHAGAHIDVHLPSGRTRQYSLCGDPDRADHYRVAVRQILGEQGASHEVHALTVGQLIEVSEPRNAFMMPLPGSGSRAERLRFIAGGIGITPILPMVRLADRLQLDWSLRYTGRHRESLPFLDQLEAFGDRVRVLTDDVSGLPTAAHLLDDVDPWTAVYACGPPPMMDLVRGAVPERTELHIERFSPVPVVNGQPFELELRRSAVIVPVRADQSALAALLAVEPDVSYSCRQGFCGSCAQQVVAGDVEHRDQLLTDEQRRLGQMLLCVSRSAGDRLVLDL
ncbi:2Fe-2S iron-sulfur cluster-binding protein [Mycobacterium adipatum]|uniref:PDR/VanB family oxidoreductase n=1 Tax=Mycobacterium adipatum TaxID=1682113 RepID=UPI0034E079D8